MSTKPTITGVIVDSREPAWVQQLAFGGASRAVAPLEHGDVLASTSDGVMLVIERKTASDLLSSIEDGRLFEQVHGMRQQTPYAYLIVTGGLYPEQGRAIVEGVITQWSWLSVQAALLKVQELGVGVVHCAETDFERMVLWLGGRARDGITIIRPMRDARPMSDAERILTSLPGIGLEKCSAILAHTTNVAWALQWLTSDGGKPVAGIGPAIKANIRKALGLNDDQELAVVLKEEKETHV